MIKRTPILSCPDPSCPLPWVEFSQFNVTLVGIELTTTRVSGPAASTECKNVDAVKERLLERSAAMPFDRTALLEDGKVEPHALAITLEGELIFVPFSKQPPILYAHLAFVNPETGDAEVLEFGEEPPDPVRALTAHVQHVERELATMRAEAAKLEEERTARAARAREETDGRSEGAH